MITTVRRASSLMTDDWFKLAGTMYRIVSSSSNDLGGVVINFYDPNSSRAQVMILIVHPKTKFKVYNQ